MDGVIAFGFRVGIDFFKKLFMYYIFYLNQIYLISYDESHK